MLSSIPCGDLELNIFHPSGTPTLVPSEALERRLDWRLRQRPDTSVWKGAKEPATDLNSLPPLAVHLHVHYLETLPTLLEALDVCRSGLHNLRLWISTDSSAKAETITATLKHSPIAEQAKTIAVRVCPNRGRNLGPLLQHLWPELQKEALVLHLHGKRSVETDLGNAWLQQLLKRLLPDGNTVQALRQQFQKQPRLGVVMPQPPDLIRPYLNWGNNFELARQFAKSMGHPLHRDAVLAFPAGGMFWARPAALEPLAQCVNKLAELPPEPLPVDGSSLHALERLVAHACESRDYYWRLQCADQSVSTTSAGETIPTELSVLNARTDDYQHATALMAACIRHQDEQLKCTEDNLERSNEQLTSADLQLNQASDTIENLMRTIDERDQQIARMRPWWWKLTRFLKQRVRAGT